ncbi:maestro heat-like repeat-containing protein family member 1 isoform X2 [Prionailurus viverrinus]|uniref:maestro heat-like repeat-containing protein family member 1 isoform X2 n=2 Tax=Felinae TaxID=338152 RepID=UPI001FF42C93|nr:maestro heat-like repeat-containing protein family member 1 isoform X2 [Prionailurus viverrinus]
MAEPYVKKLSTVLLEAITDKDPLVQEQVCGALCALGEAQPAEVLRACEEYLWQHEKLAHPYRTMILRAMETVVSSHISDLDKDMARAVIFLASSEMTRVKDLVCDWQQAASNVLVAVGKQFIGLVMEEVLSKFQPGALPHYFVVQTLANLAASNVFGMVPFLTSILSTMLPMLGMAKHDTMRVAFCCALQHFSESTLEYLANLDQAPDPTVRKDTFATDIFSAYDILFNHWLQSREAKLRLAVVEALGPMSHLLPSEKLEEQLPKLLPGVLALYRKHAETFHVSKSLGQILEAAVSVGSRTLEAQLDALLAALHAQICVPVESSSPLVASNRKEVLRCFTVLACCSPDRLLAFLLPKLDANNERTRVGTLQVVRHVINSAASQMEVKKPFILSSMRLPLLDTNSKVKRAVVQVISAMAHHGYLEQPGGEAMVAYIVQQCALPPEAEALPFLRMSVLPKSVAGRERARFPLFWGRELSQVSPRPWAVSAQCVLPVPGRCRTGLPCSHTGRVLTAQSPQPRRAVVAPCARLPLPPPPPTPASEAGSRQRGPRHGQCAGRQHQHPVPGQHHRGQDEPRPLAAPARVSHPRAIHRGADPALQEPRAPGPEEGGGGGRCLPHPVRQQRCAPALPVPPLMPDPTLAAAPKSAPPQVRSGAGALWAGGPLSVSPPCFPVTLPSPYAITTRLLTVSSNPYLGDGRGAASLRLLSVLHRNIHPLLGQRWATTVPLLLEHLDEHTEETLSQKEWEERLLAFLRDTLAVVSDNTWICQLSLEMCRQLPCYNGTPQEKNFLYKCIGTTLGAASSKEVVRKHLQELLETARHQEEAEREGLACCFGICATSHLDDVLAQLEDFMRSDVFRRSTGIFNIFKDRSENEVEKVKSTLILCYGHVAARAPRELVLAKVESDILRNIFQYFSTKVLGIKVETKDPALKLCLIQSVCMASQAICSSAQAGSFHFSRKAELVAQMMEFIKAEPPDSLRTPIRKKAMLACTYLVSLEPALEERVQADLIRGCLHSVMAVLPEPEGEEERQESLYLDTMHALEDLLTSLLRRNMTPQGLQIMVEHLSPWIRSPRGHERVRALGLSACLLQHFLEHLHVSALVPFHNLGLLIGLFSPRCADLWPATRQEAVSCVHALLYLQLGYEGFSRDYRDDVAEQLLALKEGLVHPDPAVLFHTCHSIAQIIAKRLPPEQLISLLLTLFESLGDPDKNCSRAATIMVNCLLRERGSMLQEKVPEIVSVLRSKLQETREEHVLQAAQHSVYLLASQHCAAVVSSLLGGPLPFDSHTCTLWRALALEPSLTTQVLGLLLEKMSRDVPFKETRAFLLSSSPGREATLLPLAATCALHEVLSALESGPAVLELYPQLFAALLLRVSCTLGVLLPRSLQAKERRSVGSAVAPRSLEPCSCAVDALQAMLLRGGNEDVVRRVELEGGWQLLRTSAGHEEGVTRLASAMAKCAGPRLPLVMKALVCTQSSVYEIQRVTSTAFLAELLNSNVVNDLMLLESLLDNLAARQKDTSASVRRLVLRGLANIASSSPEKVQAHGPQLLTAMIGGLDDRDDPHSLVALEAMVGLARLLELVKRQDLRSVLLHVAIRIRPFFDSEKTELRSASIRLFGHLNQVCHGGCEDVFLEQVVAGLVPLLLHLQDPQAPVTNACRFALRLCGPNLQHEELAAVFQKHLQEGRGLHFGEFLNATCKLLMYHFPELLGRLAATSLFYFKSSWEDVRAAAPMLMGFLVLHAEPEHQPQVDLEQITAALQLLLKDPAPLVRAKAAETLGRLVKFA